MVVGQICKNGHTMTPENLNIKHRVVRRRLKNGITKEYNTVERCCIQCYRDWRQQYNDRQRKKQWSRDERVKADLEALKNAKDFSEQNASNRETLQDMPQTYQARIETKDILPRA